ncbi:hypothetical protein B0H14DRAFT_3432768 [Mycena olivaceomarginata]|nr:hypothetical protein B0H14DRAFT_3432768 [Mycena olivaceomarginata]
MPGASNVMVPQELVDSILSDSKERYTQLQVNSKKPAPTTSIRAAASQKKCRRASTPMDDDVDMSNTSATHLDPIRPWLDEFNEYLQARETVPEGVSVHC